MFSNDIKSKEKCVNVLLSRKMQPIVCRTHTCHHRLKESALWVISLFFCPPCAECFYNKHVLLFCNKENNQIGGREKFGKLKASALILERPTKCLGSSCCFCTCVRRADSLEPGELGWLGDWGALWSWKGQEIVVPKPWLWGRDSRIGSDYARPSSWLRAGSGM